MSKLDALKKCNDLRDFSALLGFKPSHISFVLFIDPSPKYTTFTIPKATGGARTIEAPRKNLREIQRSLSALLYAVEAELNEKKPARSKAAHGFTVGKTIGTNARTHQRRRYILNVDLENFFGSINFGRVRGFFIKDKELKLHEKIATLIAQIACFDNRLPQGSPCSPIISNLIGRILDAKLTKLAYKQKCTYTRYVDDITLSTNRKDFPEFIAKPNCHLINVWDAAPGLESAISSCGFTINTNKTRMQIRGSRQTVTGLTVNSHVNVPAEYYKTVRAMCHSLFTKGYWHQPTFTGVAPVPRLEFTPLEGMISHLVNIKSRSDRSKKENDALGFKTPKAIVDLERNFFFYTRFFRLRCPIIITEGDTDAIYLRCAIRARCSSFPHLAVKVSGKTTLFIRFIRYSEKTRRLGLVSGASGLKNLYAKYSDAMKGFHSFVSPHPVIMICDNDSGPEALFDLIKKKTKRVVSISTTDDFYHLEKNLYLVKVPEGTPPREEEIEGLFEPSVLKIVLNGRTFDSKAKPGDKVHYGKKEFASKVIRANEAAVDFEGFDQLLDRIEKCILDYSKRHSKFPKPVSSLTTVKILGAAKKT